MRGLMRTVPLVLAAALTAGAPLAAAAQPAGPRVDIVEVSGVIDRSIADYVELRLGRARSEGTALVVLQIDSPGGLKVPAGAEGLPRVVRRVLDSPVPVAAWVGPRGARAGSTAVFLLAAAHVAAVGPSARVGPALPADLGHRERRAADAEALRRIASVRGRALRGDLPPALGANASVRAGLADLVAPSVADLLRRLDGTTLTTAAGPTTLRLKEDEVAVRFLRPGPFDRLLQTLANASLVYLLLLAGAMLLTFELFQPGLGVAGVTGIAVLAAAAYGLTVLPARGWALGSLAAGIVLLAYDVAIHGLGPPTVLGTAALAAGSAWLLPAGPFRVAPWLAGLGVAASLIFFVPLMTVVRRARESARRPGARRLVGEAGEVRSVLNPEGYVWVGGALWRARAPEGERIPAGEPVVVTGVEGLVLRVSRPPVA